MLHHWLIEKGMSNTKPGFDVIPSMIRRFFAQRVLCADRVIADHEGLESKALIGLYELRWIMEGPI